jgi:arylsulfatase A-like enzyme
MPHALRSAPSLAGALFVLIAAQSLPAGGAAPAVANDTSTPNVVIILTDDQPKGELDAMPTVQNELAAQGLTLTNGIIPTSLCCPSRSSLLTGNYAHTTGVYGNKGGKGWPIFYGEGSGPEERTIATELHGIGYQTALFGKYMNEFSSDRPPGYVPPGWDAFGAFDALNSARNGAYFNYSLVGNIGDPVFGSEPADYSTDVTAELASSFIVNADPDRPLFLDWAPSGPHSPYTPAPRHANTWPLQSTAGILAFNESDVSDKPAWVSSLPTIDEFKQRHILTLQHEDLMSIDDGVRRILDALTATGRLSNTLIIYLTDNGLMLGSHRLTGKDVPYQMSSEVDMFLRWDGVIAPATTSPRVTPQIDLTAAVKEVAGLTDWTMDGRSVLSTPRSGTVLEQRSSVDHPAYCGYRTPRYEYVQYAGDSDELYDLKLDRQEKQNVANDSDYESVRTMMRAKTIDACSPTPPGFSWN